MSDAGIEVVHLNTFWGRLIGLMGRADLPSHQAVLIAPCSSVHTCFMRFALDVYFLDKHNAVIKRYLGLKPWRIAWCGSAACALETAAQASPQQRWQLGEVVNLTTKENLL
jgi:uncharacterized protein